MSTFKKDDPFDKGNYHSMSLLSHTSKIIKKILFKQIIDGMKACFPGLLTGFSRNHSTQHCFIKMLEKWKHLNGYGYYMLFMNL